MKRRIFLRTGLTLAAAPSLLPACQKNEPEISKPFLWDPQSEEETGILEKSVMACDILNCAGKGYSCAESALITCLRYLKQPGERVQAAACFGGGMAHGSVCGLLTGGLMGIGFAGGGFHANRDSAKTWSSNQAREYWEWFTAHAPSNCRDLRTHYSTRQEYTNMAQRIAWKLETLLREARS